MQVGLSPAPVFQYATSLQAMFGGEGSADGTAQSMSDAERTSAATQQAVDAGPAEDTGNQNGPDEDAPRDLAPQRQGRADDTKKSEEGGRDTDSKGDDGTLDEQEFSDEETRIIESLQRRDRAVRAHEAAHLAAAGRYANGGASYSTEVGPDGRTYAVGGEVPIDMSAEQTPEATLMKALTLQAAALAPADPSGADRAVAAAAAQMARRAMVQIGRMQRPEADPAEFGATETAPESKATTGEDSTVGQVGLSDEVSKPEPESRSKVAENRREQLARAYAAMSTTSSQGTLKCPACDSIH